MESKRLEGVLQHRDDRLGHQALPSHGLVDPVADVGRLERTALDRGEGYLPDEASLDEDAKAKSRADLALALPDRAAADEAAVVFGEVRRRAPSAAPT